MSTEKIRNISTICNRRSKLGMTLIEIVLAMAILGFVLLMISSAIDFSQSVFSKSGKVSDVQFNMRQAAAFISQEVRYSSKVEILDASAVIPSAAATGDYYIFVTTNSSGQALQYKDSSGERTIASATTLNLLFSVANGTSKDITFTLNGKFKGESFDLVSTTTALNLPKTGANQYINKDVLTGSRIKGNKVVAMPAPVIAIESAPPAAVIGTYYSHTFSANGGTTPYDSFVLAPVTSSLSDHGLSWNASTKTISGNPSVVGGVEFKITVTDAIDQTASRTFFIDIQAAPAASGTPTATGVLIDPISGIINGSVLKASYTYNAPTDNPSLLEDGSVITWYKCSDQLGAGQEQIGTAYPVKAGSPAQYLNDIANPLDDSNAIYTITESNPAKRYIMFTITPATKNIDGTPLIGSTIKSNIVYYPPSNTAPFVKDITLVKNNKTYLNENIVLTGSFVYSDAENDPPGTHVIRWYSQAANVVNAPLVLISGQHGLTLALDKNTDENKKFYFSVQPYANLGISPGTEEKSAALGPYAKNSGHG